MDFFCFVILAVVYNQPRLCPNAMWNSNAITFADSSLIGTLPSDAFIDLNNTVYVPATSLNQVLVWFHNNSIPARNLSIGLSSPKGIFVTDYGDIFVDNVENNNRIEKWTLNATSGVTVMNNITGRCISLFVDINNTLYCANDLQNIVFKTSLNNGLATATIAAGNGTQGSGAYMLSQPGGVFVDFQLNLYVAEWGNHRIQRFRTNELNGTVIVGNGAPGTILLNGPTDVVLDADGYLFIVDSKNHRVIGSGSTGYYCIVGCTNTTGAASNQLNTPQSLIFDSYGNLFVVDMFNNRIQKFLLMINSCGKIKFH